MVLVLIIIRPVFKPDSFLKAVDLSEPSVLVLLLHRLFPLVNSFEVLIVRVVLAGVFSKRLTIVVILVLNAVIVVLNQVAVLRGGNILSAHLLICIEFPLLLLQHVHIAS